MKLKRLELLKETLLTLRLDVLDKVVGGAILGWTQRPGQTCCMFNSCNTKVAGDE